MLYFWIDARTKVEFNGLEFVGEIEYPLLNRWDWPRVKDNLAPAAVGTITEAQLQGYRAHYGSFKTPLKWTVQRVISGERDDSVVSFVKVLSHATSDRGTATVVAMTVSHITTTSSWKLEALTLSDERPG